MDNKFFAFFKNNKYNNSFEYKYYIEDENKELNKESERFAKFWKTYCNKIAPVCKDIESKRGKLLADYKAKKSTVSFLYYFALAFVLFFLYESGLVCVLGLVVVVVFTILKQLLNFPHVHQYKKMLKRRLFPLFLEDLGIFEWRYGNYKFNSPKQEKQPLPATHEKKTIFKTAEEYRQEFVKLNIADKRIYPLPLKNEAETVNEADFQITSEPLNFILPTELIKSGLFFGLDERSIVFYNDEFKGKYANTDYTASEIYIGIQDNSLFKEGDVNPGLFHGVVLKLKQRNIVNNLITVTLKNKYTKKDEYINNYFEILFLLGVFVLTIVLLLSLGIHIEFLLLAVTLESIIYTAFDNLKKSKIKHKLFSKVNLQQSKFNNSFDIHSPNPAEAEQVLTPAFMEKFYNLKKIFNSKDIRCSFYEDNILIAIQTKQDLFELGNLFKPACDSSNIEKFYSELTSIFDIIDTLNIK